MRCLLKRITLAGVIAAVLAIVGLVADLAGLLEILPGTSTRMTGDFRIAIAGFAEKGRSGDSGIGTELAQGVYLRLEQAFDGLGPELTITVWGPDQVGTIKGQNSEERASSAARVAKKVGADVIVYGIVDVTNAMWQVTPEFYVSAENFYQAEEITGQHELGTPLPIAGRGNIADRIKVSRELDARIKALSHVTIGLAHYSVRDFEEALASFQSAEGIPEWGDNEGRQVLYILSGNAAMKCDDLSLARAYYQKSVRLDPDYSRGYMGLANVYYRLALKPFEETSDPSNTDASLITLAIETYEQAASAANQPPLSDISTKVHFGLGQAYLMQVYSGHEEAFDRATAEFEVVVEDYADGANPRVREIAAESHARLALIYELSGYTTRAIEEYQLAALLLYDNPDRQAYYERRVQELEK